MRYYKIHPSAKVGYKKLTPADLGLNDSSNQTHIGLHESSVDYLKSFERQYPSILVYENSYQEMLCLLNEIQRKGGTLEAPKIRSGDTHELLYNGVKYQSLVKGIRSIVKNDLLDKDWYLMWFGLENEDLIFFIFNNKSNDYNAITLILRKLKSHGVIDNNEKVFNNIISFLEEKVNYVKTPYLEKLEIYSYTGKMPDNSPIPSIFDIEKANRIFKEIGRKGEELVAVYLDKLASKRIISSFDWKNKSGESGSPFDFEVRKNQNNSFFADVKTTASSFYQQMFFSNQELKFICQNKSYQIFRVYKIDNNPAEMRICNNFNSFSKNIITDLDRFEKSIVKKGATLWSVKIGISTLHREFSFNRRIIKL